MRKSLPCGPGGGIKRVLLGVEGERPHVVGPFEVDEFGGLVAVEPHDAPSGMVAAKTALLKPVTIAVDGEWPVSAKGATCRRPLAREDLAGVAGAEQHARRRVAPKNSRSSSRRRSAARRDRSPRVRAVRVDGGALEVAARELVERVELEGARSTPRKRGTASETNESDRRPAWSAIS